MYLLKVTRMHFLATLPESPPRWDFTSIINCKQNEPSSLCYVSNLLPFLWAFKAASVLTLKTDRHPLFNGERTSESFCYVSISFHFSANIPVLIHWLHIVPVCYLEHGLGFICLFRRDPGVAGNTWYQSAAKELMVSWFQRRRQTGRHSVLSSSGSYRFLIRVLP